jgi:hypothetical protein
MDSTSLWYIWASDTAPSIKRRIARGEPILANDLARAIANDPNIVGSVEYRLALIEALHNDHSSERRLSRNTYYKRQACRARLRSEPALVQDEEIRQLITRGLEGKLRPKRGRPRLSDNQRLIDAIYLSDAVGHRTAQIRAERKAKPDPRDRSALPPCVQAATEIGLPRMLSGGSVLNAISRYRKCVRFSVKDDDRQL